MHHAWPVFAVVVLLLGGACIASAPEGIQRETDGGGGDGGDPLGTTNTVTVSSTSSGSNDPHAVLGADPPHGPFSGGTRIVVAGKGFETNVRVWFGDTEADSVEAIDPARLQVNAPEGEPGAVDLVTQNGDDESTRRVLPAGYTYDALYAIPDNGPVAGGTVITIFGRNTNWDQDLDNAFVDNKPCTTLNVVAPDELSCTVPQGTQGTKSISVSSTSEPTITALDAYTYQDSADGFKGGLSGQPLAGQLRVLAYDNFSGDPLTGAHVIVGSNINSALYQQIDGTGVTVFNDTGLNQPVTVTVAAECHSPITFVDVPVDTVTVYLNPVLTPSCAADGDPPPGGGNPVLQGLAEGELVWPSNQEFQKGEWTNVPGTKSSAEERVAYIYFANRDPEAAFAPASSNFQVTEASPGDRGYGFSVPYFPGNYAMYAVAGIRNNQTGKFYGYSFGAVRGVALFPGQVTGNIIINMDHALDQALVMNATPPPAGNKGPDRMYATVAVEIAHNRYAIFPGMQKEPLLPLGGPISFIGLPGLDGDLTGMRYLSGASAVTGPSLTSPLSVVGDLATTTTSVPVDVTGFVTVPLLDVPQQGGGWNGTNLAVTYPQGGFPVDMSVYEIAAADGLWGWIVAVPEATHAIEVPDLTGFTKAHLPNGPIVVNVYGARIDNFDYGDISYRDLRPGGMTAYSLDVFNSFL
jgi:hypothetical protein